MKFPEQKLLEEANPSATEKDIVAAEKALGGSFPPALRKRYLKYNGVREYKSRHHPLTLMPLDDVVEWNSRAGEMNLDYMQRHHMVFCWRNNESGFLATFLNTPLEGYLAFLQMAGGGWELCFRDVDSLVPQLCAGAEYNARVKDFDDGEISERELIRAVKKYQRIFPRLDGDGAYVPFDDFRYDFPAMQNYTSRDRLAFEYLRDSLEAPTGLVEHERSFLLVMMAYLCPPNQWRDLVPYFAEQPRMIKLLARIYFAQMIPTIVSVIAASDERHNSLFSVLARGARMYPQKKSEVLDCLLRQGIDRSRFDADFEQITRWPRLVYQW